MKDIMDIADPRLVKGLAHPLRIEILRELEGGMASPSEIAERIGAPLGNVSYHVRFLARIGLIELRETRPRRGAVEHYYQLLDGVQVSEAAWASLPGAVRDTVLSATLDEVGQSIAAAVNAGGFSHDDTRAGRVELVLDRDAVAELAGAVNELNDRAMEIERAAARRIAAAPGSEDPTRVELVLMLYGSAVPVGGGAPRALEVQEP
jgi:DNA-binding transcriptional ArsR family regulator